MYRGAVVTRRGARYVTLMRLTPEELDAYAGVLVRLGRLAPGVRGGAAADVRGAIVEAEFGPVSWGPERAASRRLTEAEVRDIRRLHAEGGWPLRRLALRFGIGPDAVGNIVRGSTWRHVA